MILSLSLGFFYVSGFGEYSFVGLDNYRRMLGDPLFWQSLRVTLRLYRRRSCPRSMSSGSGSRCWCRTTRRFNGVMRSLLFMPQTVSLVVVALVWQVLLVDKIGLFNQFSAVFGLSKFRGSAIRVLRSARHRHQRLVPDGILHADLPRRPAGHSQGILRSGPHRRRRPRAVFLPDHAAAVAADQLLRAARLRR